MNNCIQEDDNSEAYWIKPILSKTHDRLIHLNVRCANHDINAILNTESQLNICNVKLAQLLQLSIDKTQRLNMNDVNDDQGMLKGLL